MACSAGHAERQPAGLVAACRRQRLADQRDQPGRGRADVDDGRERERRPGLPGGRRRGPARSSAPTCPVRGGRRSARSRSRRPRPRPAAGACRRASGTGVPFLEGAPSGAGRLTGNRPAGPRRAGASAGSAVAPQQKPGTEAAKLSRGSPVSGVNAASPQPSATCCRRPRRAASAASPSSGATQVSSPRRRRTTACASASRAARSRSAFLTCRLSGDEKARKDDATRATAASSRCRPPPSISSEKRQGRPSGRSPAAARPGHQLGEGPRMAGAEAHVERPVEPFADANASSDALGLADQQLRGQRRRERAGLRRLRESRRRVVGDGHRTPVGRRRGRAVRHVPDRAQRVLFREPRGDDPGLRQHGLHGVEQRFVAGTEAFRREVRTLRLPGVGQPVAEPPAQRPALARQPVPRQHGGPRPAGQHQGLGGHQGREAARPLRQQVVQVEAEARALAAAGLRVSVRRLPRLVGRPLERYVERMAGSDEGGVELPREASPTKRSSSSAPVIERAPSRRRSARPASRRGRPARRRRRRGERRPGAPGNSPCGLRRSVQPRRWRSSAADARENGTARASLEPRLEHGVAAAVDAEGGAERVDDGGRGDQRDADEDGDQARAEGGLLRDGRRGASASGGRSRRWRRR